MRTRMLKEAFSQIKIAIYLLVLLSILTGLIYPLFITALAQLFFSRQANGSLVTMNGKAIGSVWIGQSFSDAKYFWGRPSATSPFPYNGANSSGSNMGPTNPDFLAQIKDRVNYLHQIDPENKALIPVDLVTASGSGLDPEISLEAAFYQVSRIAKARQLPESDIQSLISTAFKMRMFGMIGKPRVNVLQLNLILDTVPRVPWTASGITGFN